MSFFGNIGKFFKKSVKSLSNPVKYLGDLGTALIGGDAFADYDGNLGVLGNLGGTMQDFWKDYTGQTIAEKNLDFQREQFDYQKMLNEKQMQREDTAYQRKVADMTKAGFNPILATGGSGSPSAPLHAATAPQLGDYSGGIREGLGVMSDLVMRALTMRKDFAVKDAEISKLYADRDKAKAETAGIRTENKYIDEYYSARNRSMVLANQATESKLPLELKKLTKDIDLKDQELVLKNLQEEADRLRISGLEKDNLYKDLQNDYAFKNLNKIEQEIEINSLLIARKTLENSEYEYAVKFYHDRFFGLPYDGKSAPSVETLTYMALRQGIDVVDGKMSQSKTPKPKPPRKFTRAELKELLKRPSASNILWTRRMNQSGDYGVRRNF